MKNQSHTGMSRQGLDADFTHEEIRKSNLILEAELLREQQQHELAAAKFAEAAEIEEQLSRVCEARGLIEKALLHRFSAASCWAQAGDFHHGIVLCEELLARPDLPARLRQRVRDYSDTLRSRRAQWYSELVSAKSEADL